MLNNLSIQNWQHRALNYVLDEGVGEFSLVILKNEMKKENRKKTFNFYISVIKNKCIYFLFDFFKKVQKNKISATKKVSAKKLFQSVPQITCSINNKGKFSEYFNDEDIKILKEYNLDIIIRFGFGIVKGEVLSAAKYGIWSYHHGDENKYRGLPPIFWEIYNNDNLVGSILQRVTNKLDSGFVLQKGFYKNNFNYPQMVDKIYFDTSYWIALTCKKILNGQIRLSTLKQTKTNASIYKKPTNSKMLFFFIRKILNAFLSRIHNLFFYYRDEWRIGIIRKSVVELLGDNLDNAISLNDIDWLENEKDCFFADPFICGNEFGSFLFFEKFSYNKDKGSISVAKINNSEIFKPVDLLTDETHYSYPHKIMLGGEIFIVPEEHEKKEINIYKYNSSRLSCVKVSNIISGDHYVDPTLFFHNDIWWLFFSIHKDNENLFLWHSEDLFCGWEEHILNPIKTDVRSSRSAGPIFYHNGKIIRPAQDCSKNYGGRIVLNEIKLINKKNYLEEPISYVNPISNSKFIDGIHTISSIDGYTAIDSKKMVRKLKISRLL